MKRAQRGYIMVVVLLCLAAVTVTGALVMSQSEDQMVTTASLRNQSIAAARASLGAQRGLAELRMPNLPSYLSNLENLQPCQSYEDCVTLCGGTTLNCPTRFVTMPKVDLGRNSGSLSEGGGSQYFVQFYREQKESETPITVIVSTGYYGFDPTVVSGANRFESMVLVEVGGNPVASQTCTGYCGGGL